MSKKKTTKKKTADDACEICGDWTECQDGPHRVHEHRQIAAKRAEVNRLLGEMEELRRKPSGWSKTR